ncbi:helix-turn-helix domain-containing protein [Streptomyces sp. NPDC048639]|uniref:helix-turn-helix domain-containing protein n=1 Tax=Streptomyces sp. NPDC048639 TaxID=3365581 RepID=UPI00371E4F23
MHPRKRKNASSVRLVGALTAQFRRSARLTQRELGERLGLHEETIASIEQGRRPLKPDLAEDLDRLLETKGALAVAVANMPDVDKFPVWAAEFIDYEREAIDLSSYENQVIPGLLQTESYARAVIRNDIPPLSEEDIEVRVAARMERQDILRRKVPPSTSFIISEAVLRDRLGGEGVHREQVCHLLACTEWHGVVLQIMPGGRQTHAGLSGPFVLLETPGHDLLAYAETQRGSMLISDPDEVSILARKYAMLRTQALNPDETKGELDRLRGEQ